MQYKSIQFRQEQLPSSTFDLVQSLALDNDSWCIERNQCKQVEEILQHAVAVIVELITIKAQLPGEILKPSITFTHLVFLELDNSGLFCIQFLKDLRAPLLENLSLESNLITSIRPLRKSRLPNLSRLKLNGNPIQDCSTLVQFYGLSQNFTLVLEDKFDDAVISQNLNFLFKMQTKHAKIYCQSQQRISHQYLINAVNDDKDEKWFTSSSLQLSRVWSNVNVQMIGQSSNKNGSSMVGAEADKLAVREKQFSVLNNYYLTRKAIFIYYHLKNSSFRIPLHLLHPSMFLFSPQLQCLRNSIQIEKSLPNIVCFCLPKGDIYFKLTLASLLYSVNLRRKAVLNTQLMSKFPPNGFFYLISRVTSPTKQCFLLNLIVQLLLFYSSNTFSIQLVLQISSLVPLLISFTQGSETPKSPQNTIFFIDRIWGQSFGLLKNS